MKKDIYSTNYLDDQHASSKPGSKVSNGGIKIMGDLPGTMMTAR